MYSALLATSLLSILYRYETDLSVFIVCVKCTKGTV